MRYIHIQYNSVVQWYCIATPAWDSCITQCKERIFYEPVSVFCCFITGSLLSKKNFLNELVALQKQLQEKKENKPNGM